SVDASLRSSLTESARLASAAIQPVVEATMAGIARETSALHDTVAQAAQQQLEGVSNRLESTTQHIASTWQTAFGEHQRGALALSTDLRDTLQALTHSAQQQLEGV